MNPSFTRAILFVLLLIASAFTTACQSGRPAEPAGAHQIAVTERGFEPATLKVPANQPVTLVVTRKTEHTCATELIFADTKQRYDLPLNKPVTINLPASAGGTLRYACGMDMIKGEIVVD